MKSLGFIFVLTKPNLVMVRKFKYITTEEIVAIHDEIIKETGGYSGIISYSKIPKTIERVAATLFYGILTSHPFVDGNKRTALESMKTFLSINGKKFAAYEDNLWEKLHSVSEGKLKFEETVKWIKRNVV